MNTLSELLKNIVNVFRRFTVMPDESYYTALALYVVYTHLAEAFDFAPKLVITSAEKRSGKTRTLELLIKLCKDVLPATNATTAALFRSLETVRTVVLDEADTIFGTRIKAEQNEDLRGLLNSSFQRGGFVLRTVGPSHEVKSFHTFSPVVMAAIGTLPDTITDRAVNLRLRRKKASETVEQYRARLNDPDLIELHNAIAETVEPLLEQAGQLIPENPLMDRAADLWEPLLVVAELAGGDWPERARYTAVRITENTGEDDEQSEGLELLNDCKHVWENFIQGSFVKTQQLLEYLKSIEDSRWGLDLTSRRISDLLRPYGIRPGRDASGTSRGYKKSQFIDAFERYLSMSVSEPSEPSKTPETQGKSSVTLNSSDASNRQTEMSRQVDSPTATREADTSDASDINMDEIEVSDTLEEASVAPKSSMSQDTGLRTVTGYEKPGWSPVTIPGQKVIAQEPDPGYCKGCGGSLPCHKAHTKTEQDRLAHSNQIEVNAS